MQAAPAPTLMDSDGVWAALGEIPDPEIPTISIVDLGVVRSVDLSDESGVGRAAADIRRLPGPRGHPRSGRGPARRRPAAGRRRVQLRGALDDRADHGSRPARADRRRVRAADAGRSVPCAAPRSCRWTSPSHAPRAARAGRGSTTCSARRLPVDPLLPGLPPTLRRLQGGVTMADEKTGTPPTPPTPPAAPTQPAAPPPAPPAGAAPPAAAPPRVRRRVRRRTRLPATRAGRPVSNGR